jgi:multiple sugar transport system permease protein
MARTVGSAARVAHVAVKRPSLQQRIYPYIWLLPVLVIMAAVLLYPWIVSFLLSFQSWTPLRPAPPQFVGLDNYARVFTDPTFHTSLVNTAVLVVTTVTVQFLGGFALALMLNTITVGRGILLTMYLLPLMVTPSVVGLSWKLLLHNEWGIFNWALTAVGLPRIGWLSDPAWTMFTIVMVDVWQHLPFGALILLAGLQAIPDEQIEAAKVDGANAWQTFVHIVLPFLAPLILITLLFRLIFALRTFDIIYSLFRSGGPANAGMVIGVYLYEQLRITWRLGLASAISYILLLLTMALAFTFIVRWYRGAFED